MIPSIRRAISGLENVITLGDTRAARRRTGASAAAQRRAPLYRAPPLKGETKALDTDLNLTSSNATPTITLLNGIAQGITGNSRVGRKAIMKSVKLNISIIPSTVSCAAGTLRMLLVWDKINSGTTPTFGDVMTGAGAGLTRGQPEITVLDRFRILMDKMFTVNATTSATGNFLPTVKKYVKIGKTTHWSQAGATAGDMQGGCLWLLFCGSHTDQDHWTAYGTSRVRFIDANA